MGAKWKEMSEEEKRPFSEKAAAAKETYATDLAAYNASKGESVDEPATKKAKAPVMDADEEPSMDDNDDDDDDDDDDME